MISNVLSLTKVFLKSVYSDSGTKKKKTGKILLYGFLFLYLGGLAGFFSVEMINFLKDMRQTHVFLGFIVAANVMMCLFLTILSSINVLYFSKDNLDVLPLPLTPSEITAAKLNVIIIYEYLEEIFLGLIPMVIFGVMTGQPFYYYLIMVIVLLMLPVVPVCLASLLTMLLMSFSRKFYNKKVFQIFSMLIALLFAASVSFFSGRATGDERELIIMMMKANGMVEVFKKILPTVRFAVDALLDAKILSLLLLILVSAGVYALMVLFSHKLYFRGMLGSLFSSSGISRKKIDETKAFNSRGLLTTYVGKEWKTLLRSPMYLVQIILPVLILPVFITAISYFSFSSGLKESGLEASALLKDVLADPEMRGIVFIVLFLYTLFTSMYSFLPALAISKDGKDAAFMRSIPVPFYKQILYKCVPDVQLTLLAALIIQLIAVLLFQVPLWMAALVMLIMIPYSTAHSAIILFDLRAPKLNWSNEVEIVKRNFRTMIPVGFAMGNIALIAAAFFALKLDFIPLCFILFALYTLLSGLFYLYIRKKDFALAAHIS